MENRLHPPQKQEGFVVPEEITTDNGGDAASDVESDSEYSSSSSLSCLSFDAEDEFLSMFAQTTSGVKRSKSLPTFQDEEMSTMQVAILLNQVRIDDEQKKRYQLKQQQLTAHRHSMQRTNCVPGSGMSAKSAPGKMVNVKHIQGDGAIAAGEGQDESQPAQHDDPTDILKDILGVAGYSSNVLSFDETTDFFQGVTPSRLNAYSSDIIGAVRTSDLDSLRIIHKELNRNMNACNRFGESILHTACRTSQVDVVKFLVHEAKVNIRVRDDFGRTPCHDAAWQGEPNMELIELIIAECPDLLLVQDKRGFTPLQYVRKPQRKYWNEMLDRMGDSVLPKTLVRPDGDRSATSASNSCESSSLG
jgi:hypothetical protein